ncbi:helix-turn-helix domain-containing protein [Candidatus Amarolinea aalborgensis]|uniref:helix-turn-helix domain-containing protein n=1 Tax=Candidatus Amarolinea aalborgensis TaxID=2249329 RepID=UPI003BFA05DC
MNAAQWSDLPLVLTSEQAAGVLQIDRRTLTNMLNHGALRGVKIGKKWRVSRTEMMRFVEGNGAKITPLAASLGPEAVATLVSKDGLLVVRAELLSDLAEVVKQEREQRITELMQQVGL